MSSASSLPPVASMTHVVNFRSFCHYTVADSKQQSEHERRSIKRGALFRSANVHLVRRIFSKAISRYFCPHDIYADANDAEYLCSSDLVLGENPAVTAKEADKKSVKKSVKKSDTLPASDVRPINGIKTIIDLRSRDEQRKDFLHDDQSKQGHLIQHFTVVDCRTDLKNGVISPPSSSDSATTRYLVPIPLVSSHDLFKCIYNLAPWYRKLIFMMLSLCMGPLRAFQKVLYPVFCQSMTLEIFYRFLVSEKHSQQKICEVLKTCATPSNYPLVFHCTHGKDRTGLIAALILSVLGVDDACIVTDYAATEHLVSYEERVKHLAPGMDAHIWAGTPAVAMQTTLSHIRQTYGSVADYLNVIGFDREWQQRLRDALLEVKQSSKQ